MTYPVIRTVIDYPTYRNYFFFNLRRSKSFLVIVLLGVLAIVYTGVMLVLSSVRKEAITILTLAPFLVLLATYLVYFLMVIFKIKADYKKHEESFKTPLIYTFTPNHFEIGVEGAKDPTNRVIVKYDRLKGVFDGPNIYYLVLNDKKVYMVSKDFIAGSSLELIAILRTLTGLYYRKMN